MKLYAGAQRLVLAVLLGPVAAHSAAEAGAGDAPPPAPPLQAASQPAAAPGKTPLPQRQFLQAVVANNAEIAFSRLQADVAAAGADAEDSLYTPTLYSTLRREMRLRQRSFDEKTSSLVNVGTAVLDEEVHAAELGVRVKALTGADLSLGLRGNLKRNNLLEAAAATGGVETTGSLVLTLRQPLLRGAGRETTETDLKLAELEREVGRAQYRQQLLRVGADALSAYWQLQRAYGAHPLHELLLVNARETAEDLRLRESIGRVAPAAEVEANAALAMRQAALARSSQAVVEAEVRLSLLLGQTPGSSRWLLDPIPEPPAPSPSAVDAAASASPGAAGPRVDDTRVSQALEQWPAWHMAKMRLEQGRRRLAFARDQTQPLLDLQVSYASSGLARTPHDTLSTIRQGNYPDWSVGLTLEVPLGSRTRGNAQLEGQQIKLRQAELEAQTVRQTLAGDLYSHQAQRDLARQEVLSLADDGQRRRSLLDQEAQAWRSGLAARARVLRREADWLESRLRLSEAQARLQVAEVLLSQTEGRLLKEHGVEFER